MKRFIRKVLPIAISTSVLITSSNYTMYANNIAEYTTLDLVSDNTSGSAIDIIEEDTVENPEIVEVLEVVENSQPKASDERIVVNPGDIVEITPNTDLSIYDESIVSYSRTAIATTINLNSTEVIYRLSGEFTKNNFATKGDGEFNIIFNDLKVEYKNSAFIIDGGTANIILVEGSQNILTSIQNSPRSSQSSALQLSNSANLKIDGLGSLVATGCTDGNGIGSGRNGISGTIEILNGNIKAIGGKYASGIGTGEYGKVGKIVVSGGNLETIGGNYSAGIGTGYYGEVGEIIITGGTVKVAGGEGGVGIGASQYGKVETIKISDGIIETINNLVKSLSPGIGAGMNATIEDIIITGGNIDVTGGSDSAGIGISAGGEANTIQITGGIIKATSFNGAGIGSGDSGYVKNSEIGNIIIAGDAYIEAIGGYNSPGIGAGSATDYNNIVGDILISGDSTVIAKGGFKGTGIGAGGTGGNNSYSISEVGNITISENANVSAKGDNGAAGIGIGNLSETNVEISCAKTGNITMTDNVIVNATSGEYVDGNSGPGIGSSRYGEVGDITISGEAKVTAIGTGNGAGIGNVQEIEGKLGSITIYDGATVKAYTHNGPAITPSVMNIDTGIGESAYIVNAYLNEPIYKNDNVTITATGVNSGEKIIFDLLQQSSSLPYASFAYTATQADIFIHSYIEEDKEKFLYVSKDDLNEAGMYEMYSVEIPTQVDRINKVLLQNFGNYQAPKIGKIFVGDNVIYGSNGRYGATIKLHLNDEDKTEFEVKLPTKEELGIRENGDEVENLQWQIDITGHSDKLVAGEFVYATQIEAYTSESSEVVKGAIYTVGESNLDVGRPSTPITPELPVVPTEPERPFIPITPELPVVPTEPERPFIPITPELPTEPEGPTDPYDPDEPTDPVKPTEPIEPTEPEEDIYTLEKEEVPLGTFTEEEILEPEEIIEVDSNDVPLGTYEESNTVVEIAEDIKINEVKNNPKTGENNNFIIVGIIMILGLLGFRVKKNKNISN